MKTLPILLLASGVLLAADKPSDDAKAIQGKWKLVAIEEKGKKDDIDEKHAKFGVMTVTADKMMVERNSKDAKDGKVKEEAAYKIDASKTPKSIDMNPAREPEVTIMGIFELKGDDLKLCFSKEEKPTRPTDFKATEENKAVILTFKRTK